jgi:hypothetical protein
VRGLRTSLGDSSKMGSPGIDTNMIESHDTLVKILATIFLNPADPDGQGRKIFIQQFLGCGCPDQVVEQARVSFFVRPLETCLERRIASNPPSTAATPLEKEVNRILELPETLRWPRGRSGRIVHPSRWGSPAIERAAETAEQKDRLVGLRQMCRVTVDAVIDVTGRAFFFIVAQNRADKAGLRRDSLALQYRAGQLLYQIMGYNRCRLFTITPDEAPKRIPEIDTALTWRGFYRVFSETRDRYPFAGSVLELLEPAK